jgi:ABC-2 type transport system ATP-binding protein
MRKTVLISSHILTELGEICDSAAIIEAGQILVSGTIDEIRRLQRAKRGRTANATLRVRVLGDLDPVERWILEQPFCSHAVAGGELVTFDFEGDALAQHELLKRMFAAGFRVLEFAGHTDSLEDAFMSITEGITQ